MSSKASILLICSFLGLSHSYSLLGGVQLTPRRARCAVRACDDALVEAEAPDSADVSDIEPDAEPPIAEEIDMVSDIEDPVESMETVGLKLDLLRLAAGCSRGENASPEDIVMARSLVDALEARCPTPEPALECEGRWELAFSDTQLFRSSPFFMAGRAVCADGDEAERYDWFCDMHRAALAISTIGKVRQIVSEDKLISEFEVKAGAVPFVNLPPFGSGGLPFTIDGTIVSTASIEAREPGALQLLMDTVEIKGSNLPLLRQVLDAGLRLPTRSLGGVLEQVVPSYANPQPRFLVTYCDKQLRISRDQDGKIFVYTALTADTTATDYSSATADLGVGELLSGLSKVFLG